MAKQNPKGRGIPVRWCFPPNLAGRYATNLVVQNTGHEFVISFFEAAPPLLFGSEEEVQKQLEKLDYIDAMCVARIIVSPERMPEFVEVLRQNLERFLAKQEE